MKEDMREGEGDRGSQREEEEKRKKEIGEIIGGEGYGERERREIKRGRGKTDRESWKGNERDRVGGIREMGRIYRRKRRCERVGMRGC